MAERPAEDKSGILPETSIFFYGIPAYGHLHSNLYLTGCLSTADSEYSHCGVLKLIHPLSAYEHLSSGKFIYHHRNNSCILFVFMIV